MGKRIIVQRRGRGGSTYKAGAKGYKYKLQIPKKLAGEGEVVKLVSCAGISAPIAKVNSKEAGSFYVPACNLMFEGQKLIFEGEKIEKGNIVRLKDIPIQTKIYCVESRPGDGGKFVKGAGNTAVVLSIGEKDVNVLMPSKKQKKFNGNCRAIIGTVAGTGRLDKPFVKAGRKYHLQKAKNKLWPRTSAVKMNAIDHPFGSGRGKVPKQKISKRNASPGKKVGLIRPNRTGKRK